MTTWQELRDRAVQDERRERTRVRAIRPNHGRYIEAVESHVITICVGPAGTGKSWMACGLAARFLQDGKCKRIILSRPLVSCGGGIGFLPGNLEEKVSPYLRPLLDAFAEFFDERDLQRHIEDGTIEMLPLDLMRGSSFKDAVILCDEAQNARFTQLHMLLTRPDRGSKLIVTGDDTRTQTDLPPGGLNPLREVIMRLEHGCHPQIAIVRLTHADVVRNDFNQWVDERLTMPLAEARGNTPAGETEQYEDGPWYELKCPDCQARLWYEDPDDSAEQVRCYLCGCHLDLWRGAQYEPRKSDFPHELPTPSFPEKP